MKILCEENFKHSWEFPGSRAVRRQASTAEGMGLITSQKTKILHATRSSQEKVLKNTRINLNK